MGSRWFAMQQRWQSLMHLKCYSCFVPCFETRNSDFSVHLFFMHSWKNSLALCVCMAFFMSIFYMYLSVCCYLYVINAFAVHVFVLCFIIIFWYIKKRELLYCRIMWLSFSLWFSSPSTLLPLHISLTYLTFLLSSNTNIHSVPTARLCTSAIRALCKINRTLCSKEEELY